MRAWLRRGVAAASLAGDRSDLWPAGTLASLAYLGWLPLLLVVAPFDASDIQDLGVSLYTSGSYPANVIALAVAAVSGFLLLGLLAAAAETALTQAMALPAEERRTFGQRALEALPLILLATVPAMIAGAAVASGLAAHAAAEFTSPDIDRPVLLRLALAVLPQVGALLVALLIGQAVGGTAVHLALRPGAAGVRAALRDASRRLARNPWGPLGVAAVGWLKDLAYLLVSYALLRVLWAPIGAELGPGMMATPETLLLLVGFVAVWLTVLLAGGALHVAISAWWVLEVASERHRQRRATGLQPGPQGEAGG